VRNRTFAEDASTVRLRLLGATNTAKTTRAIRDYPNTPHGPWASPTARTLRELEAALVLDPPATEPLRSAVRMVSA
jgi:hypothetical protein